MKPPTVLHASTLGKCSGILRIQPFSHYHGCNVQRQWSQCWANWLCPAFSGIVNIRLIHLHSCSSTNFHTWMSMKKLNGSLIFPWPINTKYAWICWGSSVSFGTSSMRFQLIIWPSPRGRMKMFRCEGPVWVSFQCTSTGFSNSFIEPQPVTLNVSLFTLFTKISSFENCKVVFDAKLGPVSDATQLLCCLWKTQQLKYGIDIESRVMLTIAQSGVMCTMDFHKIFPIHRML